ncbi:MAG: undecaprenyl-phosphate glucose phosphotransferase [Pseudomonadota bacterium]
MASAADHAIESRATHRGSDARVSIRRAPEILDQNIALAMVVLRVLDPVVAAGTLLLGSILLGIDIALPERIGGVVVALLVAGIHAEATDGQPWRRSGWSAMASTIVASWTMVVGALVVIGALTDLLDKYTPAQALVWLLGTPALMLACHSLVRALLLLYLRQHRRTAVGVAFLAHSLTLRRALQDADEGGIDFLGFFDDRSRDRLQMPASETLLGDLAATADYVRRHSIDLVYVALPMRDDARIRSLLGDLSDSTTSVYFVPDMNVVDTLQGRVDQVGGIPVLGIWETPYYGTNALTKRLFDLLAAGAALVLLAPLMLAIAVAVKASSPGPVLFRQRRYGFGGHEITIYKFRSMTVCEDGSQVTQATRNDQRITPIGRVLRRLSLDELPQFINVLQGRMSIVGPRPHAVAHNEQYRQLISRYMHRHKIKPGITGWAQINGLRGETDTLDKMRARVEYDLEYVRNWSLWLDVRIMLRTAGLVLRDANAY